MLMEYMFANTVLILIFLFNFLVILIFVCLAYPYTEIMFNNYLLLQEHHKETNDIVNKAPAMNPAMSIK